MIYAWRLQILTQVRHIDTQSTDKFRRENNGTYYMSFEGQHYVQDLEPGKKTIFRVWYDQKRKMISWGESPKSPTPDYRDVVNALRYFLKKLDSDELTNNFQYETDLNLDAYIDSQECYTVTANGMECSIIGVNKDDQLVSPYTNWYGKYQVARATLPALLEALEDFLGGDES